MIAPLQRYVVMDSSHIIMIIFWGKTYDVSPYDSQRSHPSMNLGVELDLCVLFVQTVVKCQACKFVWANCKVYCFNKMLPSTVHKPKQISFRAISRELVPYLKKKRENPTHMHDTHIEVEGVKQDLDFHSFIDMFWSMLKRTDTKFRFGQSSTTSFKLTLMKFLTQSHICQP